MTLNQSYQKLVHWWYQLHINAINKCYMQLLLKKDKKFFQRVQLLKEVSLLQTCSNSYVYLSIPEDQTPPSVLITLTCTDADSGASGTLTYSIVSGNAAGAFDVQNNGGNCDVRLVTGGIIDFDTSSNSAFQVNMFFASNFLFQIFLESLMGRTIWGFFFTLDAYMYLPKKRHKHPQCFLFCWINW